MKKRDKLLVELKQAETYIIDKMQEVKQKKIIRNISQGNRVKIASVLKDSEFTIRLAKEKPQEWLSGEKLQNWKENRQLIIKDGESKAKPDKRPAQKKTNNIWRNERFEIYGKILRQVGANLWKIEVAIDDINHTGIFYGNELIFIRRSD